MNDTAPIDEPSGGEAGQLGPPLIALFRGVLYADAQPRNWQQLIRLQARVRDHVGVLGLELMLDESEGCAYLRQRPRDKDRKSKRLLRNIAPTSPGDQPATWTGLRAIALRSR